LYAILAQFFVISRNQRPPGSRRFLEDSPPILVFHPATVGLFFRTDDRWEIGFFDAFCPNCS
jgi:hypothetical protein